MADPDTDLAVRDADEGTAGRHRACIVFDGDIAPGDIGAHHPSRRFHSAAVDELEWIAEVVVNKQHIERRVACREHVVPSEVIALEVRTAAVSEREMRIPG